MRRLEPGEDPGQRTPEHHGVQVHAAPTAGAGSAIDAQHALEQLGPGGPADRTAWSGSALLDRASPEQQRLLALRTLPLRLGWAAAFAEGSSLARYRLPDPPAGVDPLSTTPELLDGFQRAIEALRPTGLMPSFRLARNARAYLAEAAAWPELGADTGRLLGDLVHLLLLPRLDCSADAARQALQALTEVTRSWCNADLDRELVELRARADDARHGDFRGLA